MSETANFRLPLVQAAQAQKHVTVNEALLRLDAMAQLTLASRSLAAPPVSAPDGTAYAIPEGASGAWAGAEGRIALWLNGGWELFDGRRGWRGWVEDETMPAIFDGAEWMAGAAALSSGGAAFSFRIVERDEVVSAGSASVTAPLIPAGSIVFGVTGLVIEAFGGTASSFRIGIGGDSLDRYGSGIGTGEGAWFRGVTGMPLAYFAETPLTITAEGGTFGGGLLRIAVHIGELGIPRA
jgi:hypothetical protein